MKCFLVILAIIWAAYAGPAALPPRNTESQSPSKDPLPRAIAAFVAENDDQDEFSLSPNTNLTTRATNECPADAPKGRNAPICGDCDGDDEVCQKLCLRANIANADATTK
ncbi:hypothetical protein N7492_008734 [Penicillium capsulatum]|uniref:Uncharacterized protein n=1 Tax=Penicillium capsulatum TaxID=69766 RepID=A0A9W9HU13_9EURO|nr:hypothetical protein N7492_008734 [Penicillium capsulatum]KAJ6106138.1 hypothetical protein N7512_009655 [Penicillium capsulatum]